MAFPTKSPKKGAKKTPPPAGKKPGQPASEDAAAQSLYGQPATDQAGQAKRPGDNPAVAAKDAGQLQPGQKGPGKKEEKPKPDLSKMRVDTKHKSYDMFAGQWERCRDVNDGADAVKKKATKYLPALDSHVATGMMTEGATKYRAYLNRALFFNAVRRTIDGFVGLIFNRAPKIEGVGVKPPSTAPKLGPDGKPLPAIPPTVGEDGELKQVGPDGEPVEDEQKLGPDGKPVQKLGPDGKPVPEKKLAPFGAKPAPFGAKQSAPAEDEDEDEDGEELGPDGKPKQKLGPDGKPVQQKPTPKLGPDGKPVIGPDGKPVMEEAEEPELGPDGKPLPPRADDEAKPKKTKEEKQLEDVTMTGISVQMAAAMAGREILTTGRYGVLVDVTDGGPADSRPYWTLYKAEDIYNWRVEKVGNDPAVLTMVVLREKREVPDEQDMFQTECAEAFRVLRLEGEGDARTYTSQTFVRDKKATAGALWTVEEPVTPTRRGKALTFIPFMFLNSSNTLPELAQPPLIDLVDLNLSHYRTSADLENGLHFVGCPMLVLTGVPQPEKKDEPIVMGSDGAFVLDKGGTAQILSVNGETLGALERADERKRKLMAVVGARLLEETPDVEETATAVSMRHAGEHATLRSIAEVLEEAFTNLIRIHVWWSKGAGAEMPEDLEGVEFELNRDFFEAKMTIPEFQAWIAALQAEKVSYETFWQAFQRGGMGRPGVSADEELARIASQKPVAPDPMPNALPGLPNATTALGGVSAAVPKVKNPLQAALGAALGTQPGAAKPGPPKGVTPPGLAPFAAAAKRGAGRTR